MSKKLSGSEFLSDEAEALAKEIEDLADEAKYIADEKVAAAKNAEKIEEVVVREKITAQEETPKTGTEATKRKKPRLSRKKSDQFKHTMPVVLRVLLSIVLLMGAAICFAWFLIWRTNDCDVETAMDFIHEKPDIFAYNIIVVFCGIAVLAAATWRVFFSVGLSFALISIVSYINMEKVRLRDTPLLPEDLMLADQAGDIMQFVDVWDIVRLIGGIVLILVGCIFLEHCARKVIGRDTRWRPASQKVMIASRITFTSVALAISGMAIGPIYNQTAPEWVEGLNLVAWNQLDNYDRNGFLVGFLFNLGRVEIAQPDNYNHEKLTEIATKYRGLKADDDENRQSLAEIADNVIVILDETFYDPELLRKYYSHKGGDVVPNLHEIFEKYPSGYMYSPEYGGGTANIEFEVLTGLSNYWAQSFPYVAYISKASDVLSVASWARDLGFGTTALHSYDGRMYKRNVVYPILGFDEFIDASEMTYQEHENYCGYINDRSTYNEILDILKNNSEPQMIGVVTMQNHGPYDCAGYPKLEFGIYNLPDSDIISNSFQSIHESDKYLGEFIAELDDLDEKTVVLWFGDHAAGILDMYYKSEDPAERLVSHLTPYFIYANFEIPEGDEVAVAAANKQLGLEIPKDIAGVDLPIVTPNCLQNELYDILNAKKPALFYLVDEVCAEVPILARTFLKGEPRDIEALQDYELVNYDILGGKRYWDGE